MYYYIIDQLMPSASEKKFKIILTGATGMVGEGVLHECLQHPMVELVLIINRKTSGFKHNKLKEIVHENFFDLESITNSLKGYDICLFCLGVSSIGLKEDAYRKVTYDLTMNFAKTLANNNSGMVFEYISGAHTDSTEKGRAMWARVKGKTENDLLKLPFSAVYNFRPGYLHPTPGMKNTNKYYKYISWLYPLLRKIIPNSVSTLSDLGKAMLNAAIYGFEKHIVEVQDINMLAKRY